MSNCPFTVQYQMQKYNLTKEQAEYKVRSFKPMCKQYWYQKGYSEQEAIEKIKQIQNSRSHKRRNKLPLEKRNTKIEYYLAKGMTQQEAKYALHKRQSTFSLKKCIEKYGQQQGTKRFNQRQQKWLKTLNNKTDQQKKKINSKKSKKYKLIEQYGQQIGNKKFEEYVIQVNKKRKETKQKKINGSYFYEKYTDPQIAYNKWQQYIVYKKIPKYSQEWFKLRYKDQWQEELKKFKQKKRNFFKSLHNGQWYKAHYGNENWEQIFNQKKSKYHIGIASKQSLNVFIPLYKYLRKQLKYELYDILFGIRGLKQYLIYDKNTKTRKLYDFTIISDKIIIQFNGDCYNNKNNLLKSIHPNYIKLTQEELLKWKHPYQKVSAQEKIKQDKEKIQVAEQHGFKVLVVWQSDGIQYNIKKCKDFINEHRSNN